MCDCVCVHVQRLRCCACRSHRPPDGRPPQTDPRHLRSLRRTSEFGARRGAHPISAVLCGERATAGRSTVGRAHRCHRVWRAACLICAWERERSPPFLRFGAHRVAYGQQTPHSTSDPWHMSGGPVSRTMALEPWQGDLVVPVLPRVSCYVVSWCVVSCRAALSVRLARSLRARCLAPRPSTWCCCKPCVPSPPRGRADRQTCAICLPPLCSAFALRPHRVGHQARQLASARAIAASARGWLGGSGGNVELHALDAPTGELLDTRLKELRRRRHPAIPLGCHELGAVKSEAQSALASV